MLILGVISKILLVLFLCILISLMANASAKVIGIDIKDVKQRTNVKFLFLAVIFNLLFILAVAVILKFIDNKNLSILNWTLNLKSIVFSLSGILATFLLAVTYVYILNKRGIIEAEYKPSRILNFKGLFAFFVIFIAALQEEVMFRGYINTVLSVYGILASMFLSTLIFTLWHFITNKVSLYQCIDWFLGGIMLFYIYLVSGSIWVAAIIHFSRNFANVLVFNIAEGNSLVTFKKPVTPFYKTTYTLILSLLIMIFAYLYYGNIPL
ncbi:CPBP family intramembrane glutamic endopeptidase [Clostridium sp. 'White wine YQ']|uniref:CPBP family intramembrane glutamic endopeptidase n=1 Tax=Clostridium sp. 'White wine YQ' TaxID=3027474 RepID=UPI002366519C|nr:type II CAAX endopeptidase family protein [Clostridium sp. 'White wine YQ']MDD7793502.1 type II CAAX endopeptidase family protein [Clostridium sp. 'White wine YQ']